MSTLTVYSIDEAKQLVLQRLSALGNPKIAFIGQRASDVFMFTPFVNVDLVICLDNEVTGIPTISLEKRIGKKELWYSTSLDKLLEIPEIVTLINTVLPEGSFIIPYASFTGLESFCFQNGYFLLGETALKRGKFENKKQLAELKQKFQLPNTSHIVSKDTLRYDDLVKLYGSRFVIQNPHGSSGTGTFITLSEGDFKNHFNSFDHQVIVSSFHEGLTVSVNFVITDHNVIQVQPSIQVIAQPELSLCQSTFCGVDYPLFQKVTSRREKEEIHAIVSTVAKEMQREGYRGVANANIMLTGLELTDINARFMGSGLLTVQSQLRQDIIPISLINLMHFLKLSFVLSDDLLKCFDKPLTTSMIVMHNHQSSDMVAFNAPVFRIFFEGSVLDHTGRLLPDYRQMTKEKENERVCSSGT